MCKIKKSPLSECQVDIHEGLVPMNPISETIQEPIDEQREAAPAPERDKSDGGVRPPESKSVVTLFDRWLVRTFFKRAGSPPVQITLWDGRPVLELPGEPQFNVRIHDRSTLLKLCRSPDFEFGEGYSQGRIAIEGDLVRFLEQCYQYFPEAGRLSRFAQRWRLRRAHTLSSSRSNIHHHYDLGNDFYRLWLDQQLLYTCAYYPTADLSLEAAQIAKMEHVCRKLRLQPGQQVVEAGCGWGALSLYMAREYDVRVTAYNISHEQVKYARDRARQEGLSDRVEFVEDDWRSITGTYDAFVSVGMLEHVGTKNYRLLGDVIHRSLRPDGPALIHSIGKNVAEPLDTWIERRIFPGAEPPSLRQMMDIFEGHRLSVLDVENLRLHYAQTLRHWLKRYKQHEETIRQLYDDSFVRAWRLYLAGSIAAFTSGSLQLFQVVFAHPGHNRLPRSRAFLYSSDPRSGRTSQPSGESAEEMF
jgi:cyclopropane-fatty-acyl-phospholipid synthase